MPPTDERFDPVHVLTRKVKTTESCWNQERKIDPHYTVKDRNFVDGRWVETEVDVPTMESARECRACYRAPVPNTCVGCMHIHVEAIHEEQ